MLRQEEAERDQQRGRPAVEGAAASQGPEDREQRAHCAQHPAEGGRGVGRDGQTAVHGSVGAHAAHGRRLPRLRELRPPSCGGEGRGRPGLPRRPLGQGLRVAMWGDDGTGVDGPGPRQAALVRAAVRLEGAGDRPEGRQTASHPVDHQARSGTPGPSASAGGAGAVPEGRTPPDAKDRARLRAARSASSEAEPTGRARPTTHLLLTPGDARSACQSHSGAGRPQGPLHDAALHAPEPCGD